jgi:hypothetical protein
LLMNNSLLFSYSSWFFCCTWGSVLILDIVPKELRNIYTTPTTGNKKARKSIVRRSKEITRTDPNMIRMPELSGRKFNTTKH